MPPVGKSGATLTEVLISLLIMSIGVVSVISLFPLSILRALQATQLTNGKFAEQNATEIVTTFPAILYGNAPQWTPAATYTPVTTGNRFTPGDDVVIAVIPIGSHKPVSSKLFICRDNSAGSAPDFNTGFIEPDWIHPVLYPSDIDGDGLANDFVVYDTGDYYDSSGNPTPDGVPEIMWQVDTRARVIDPYGALFAESDPYRRAFGNVGFALPTYPGALTAMDPIARMNPAGTSLSLADALFGLPDSWVVDVEAIPDAFTAPDSGTTAPGSVTMPTGGEVPFDPATTPFGTTRITLVNINGTEVASRLVDNFGSNPVNVNFLWPDLPMSFDQNADGVIDIDDIGSARIEHFERRYTWLYTVSQSDANQQPRVTCVVFFNRGFSLDDEFLYDASFGNPDEDADNDGTLDGTFADVDGDGFADVVSANQVRIWWNAATDPDPVLKAGNFIFDGRAGHWYQIQSVDNIDETSTPHTALLSLSDPVYVETPLGATIGGTPPAGRAMLMRGIVHVFDLEL